ncbi:MAG: hypothetical protein JWQ35_2212 [Bacteriovoracaceae bacterium]|nr:hypothetical protein [Bacteriovoracaceae bacterium]
MRARLRYWLNISFLIISLVPRNTEAVKKIPCLDAVKFLKSSGLRSRPVDAALVYYPRYPVYGGSTIPTLQLDLFGYRWNQTYEARPLRGFPRLANRALRYSHFRFPISLTHKQGGTALNWIANSDIGDICTTMSCSPLEHALERKFSVSSPSITAAKLFYLASINDPHISRPQFYGTSKSMSLLSPQIYYEIFSLPTYFLTLPLALSLTDYVGSKPLFWGGSSAIAANFIFILGTVLPEFRFRLNLKRSLRQQNQKDLEQPTPLEFK